MEPKLNSFAKTNTHRNKLLGIGLTVSLWIILILLAEHAHLLQSIARWIAEHFTR